MVDDPTRIVAEQIIIVLASDEKERHPGTIVPVVRVLTI